jgi:hypothetical protein
MQAGTETHVMVGGLCVSINVRNIRPISLLVCSNFVLLRRSAVASRAVSVTSIASASEFCDISDPGQRRPSRPSSA